VSRPSLIPGRRTATPDGVAFTVQMNVSSPRTRAVRPAGCAWHTPHQTLRFYPPIPIRDRFRRVSMTPAAAASPDKRAHFTLITRHEPFEDFPSFIRPRQALAGLPAEARAATTPPPCPLSPLDNRRKLIANIHRHNPDPR
jgi:hypothetical protein